MSEITSMSEQYEAQWEAFLSERCDDCGAVIDGEPWYWGDAALCKACDALLCDTMPELALGPPEPCTVHGFENLSGFGQWAFCHCEPF